MYRAKRAGHCAPVASTPDADFNGQASATGLCTWRARSSPAARGRLGLAGQQPRARDPIRSDPACKSKQILYSLYNRTGNLGNLENF